MENQKIIETLASEVRRRFEGETTGHDWWHILRVWNMAKRINQTEEGDQFIVELAALLHDIADAKFHGGDEKAGGVAARQILEEYAVAEPVIAHVVDIVDHMSFRMSFQNAATGHISTLEEKVVQDADRLDAIGAIGVARAFAYGGHKGRLLYHPDVKPVAHLTKESYVAGSGATINHFYEKLLFLKDRMNTSTGREIASSRHVFMEQYLDNFFKEWDARM